MFKLKANQHDLYEELLRLWKRRGGKRAAFTHTDLVGGRIETRRLFLFPKLAAYLDWPGLAQGLVIQKETVVKRTGEFSSKLHFGITSLPESTHCDHLLYLYRNHWAVENKLHYVLDVSMGEDACRVKAGAGVMSGLRKLVLGIMHKIKGNRSIPNLMHHLAMKKNLPEIFQLQN